jgi:hypothetical protein
VQTNNHAWTPTQSSSRAPALTDRIMNKPCPATIGSEVLSVNCPLVCATIHCPTGRLVRTPPPVGRITVNRAGAVDSLLVRNLGMLKLIVQPAAWFGTPGRPNHSESGSCPGFANSSLPVCVKSPKPSLSRVVLAEPPAEGSSL